MANGYEPPVFGEVEALVVAAVATIFDAFSLHIAACVDRCAIAGILVFFSLWALLINAAKQLLRKMWFDQRPLPYLTGVGDG